MSAMKVRAVGLIPLVAAVPAAGCGNTHVPGASATQRPRTGQATCLPGDLSVSPAVVRAGDAITLSSEPSRCGATIYPSGHAYSLTLLQASPKPIALGEFPVARDGTFSARVRIPAGLSAADAFITVQGSTWDRTCPEGAAGAAYGVRIQISR